LKKKKWRTRVLTKKLRLMPLTTDEEWDRQTMSVMSNIAANLKANLVTPTK
jgi:hypothetical protein